MLDNELEIAGGCQAVQRHRNHACFHGAPEKIEEFGAILNHHQDPLAAPNSQICKSVADLIDRTEQFGVRYFPVEGPDRHVVATPFGDVTVYEVLGSIEWLGESESRNALIVDFHRSHPCRPPTPRDPVRLLTRRLDICDSDHSGR